MNFTWCMQKYFSILTSVGAVNESFDTGPEFCIPLLGYSLDPSQPTVGAQSYLESLEKAQSPRSKTIVLKYIPHHM